MTLLLEFLWSNSLKDSFPLSSHPVQLNLLSQNPGSFLINYRKMPSKMLSRQLKKVWYC